MKINNQLHIYKDGIYVSGAGEIEGAMIKLISNLKRAWRSEVLSYLEIMIEENTKATNPNIMDFLKETLDDFEGDIITNPPYSMGLEFVQRALESVRPGGKVAMFLKVQFLEGQKRGEFFRHTPPRKVYISRSRLACYKNGDMTGKPESAIAYAWYVWEKGFTGDPVIKWFN